MFELGVAVEELDELFAHRRRVAPCSSCRWRTCSRGSSRSAASSAGSRMGHSSDIKSLVDDLGEFRPTFVLAVPRVFEKVFNTASQRATADGEGKIFDRAADTAIAYSRGLDRGASALAVRAQHALFARLVYAQAARRPRRPRARTPSPAARPSGERLGHFYRGIGLHRARGLRPDRDHRRRYGRTCPTRTRSAPWAGRCPAPRSASPTTASCCSGAARSSPATGRTRRPRPRRSSATAGSTPATWARSTTRASCGSPAARRRSW